jgi:hypothetical protein
MLFLSLVINAAVGVACALIANSRGRTAVGWFFIGAFLPCFAGLILVLVLPDLKVEQERQRRLADENRRLREKLKKDRMVSDERHAEMNRRLQAHDVALGVDTAQAAELPMSPQPDAQPERIAAVDPPLAAGLRAAHWYWAQGLNRQGPIAFGELQGHWRDGRVLRDTLVWCKGMPKWVAVSSVPGLEDALDA